MYLDFIVPFNPWVGSSTNVYNIRLVSLLVLEPYKKVDVYGPYKYFIPKKYFYQR